MGARWELEIRLAQTAATCCASRRAEDEQQVEQLSDFAARSLADQLASWMQMAGKSTTSSDSGNNLLPTLALEPLPPAPSAPWERRRGTQPADERLIGNLLLIHSAGGSNLAERPLVDRPRRLARWPAGRPTADSDR